jgi:hypothetical protein
MRRLCVRLCVAVCLLGGLLIPVVGCRPGALGIQDWQRDLLGVGLSVVFDAVLAPQFSTITERQCFENQGGTLVQIDCSTIPGG